MSGSTVIVGGGNMGSALIAGWIGRGRDAASICVIEPDPARGAMLGQRFAVGVVAAADQLPETLAPESVVLAVKPPLISAVLASYRRFIDAGAILLSVAAGIRLTTLCEGLAPQSAVIRAMPNTPASIGRGMTVLCARAGISAAARASGEELMRAVGDVAWLDDEALMDAATAVSGSGPAYLFHLAECLAAAGIAAGLPASVADHLARQTLAGAGDLLLRSDETPALLREKVTSPNGVTAAALAVLMADQDLQRLMQNAVAAATARSREMAG